MCVFVRTLVATVALDDAFIAEDEEDDDDDDVIIAAEEDEEEDDPETRDKG